MLPDRQPSDMVWYYEGRNGWWQYDERTTTEIESAFSQSLLKCEVFIAGHFYVIDFANMCQASLSYIADLVYLAVLLSLSV